MEYDYYKVLGVQRSADIHAIKRAYRRKAKLCHPDKNPSPRSKRIFQVLQRAYSTLSEPHSRMLYDDKLNFHRPWRPEDGRTKEQAEAIARRARRMRQRKKKAADTPISPILFYGIHIVGLIFGMIVVVKTIIGFTMEDWGVHMLLFGIPGLAIIPDSLIGLIGKKSMLSKLARKIDRFMTFEWGPDTID